MSGHRKPPRVVTYDTKCFDLAEHFLDDEPRKFLDAEYRDLAATIQATVEDWLSSKRGTP